MKIIAVFSGLLLVFCFLACSDTEPSKPSLAPSQVNPNGDSELALLMRAMFDDGMRIKQQIKEGKTPQIAHTFEDIYTAQATEPEKVATKEYKLYADAYRNMLDQLKNAKAQEIPILYEGLVESCMNCHRAMCPGPMRRIKHMYLK